MKPPLRTFMRRDDGFALVAVLVVVMLASMVAISLLFRLRAEETASLAGEGSEQAWAAAMAGVQEALRFASAGDPQSLDWQDAPETFRDRFVFDDGANQWYFTIYGASETGDRLRYGLTDESSKLNLNEASEVMLSRLPGMTVPQAQALWDFLDANNEPLPEGCEQDYYDTLATPYAVRNAPLDTLDELLLVRGFTPAFINGEDANLNGRLDPNEDDGEEQFPPDNQDGALNRGLRDYLTAVSYDLNVDADGVPRTDLNDPTDPVFTNGLPPAVVQFIDLLQTNAITVLHPADLLEMSVTVKGQTFLSPVGKEELPAVLDLFCADYEEFLPGLINVNTASATVLQALPDIDASAAEAIVAARRGLSAEQRGTPAWLFQEDLVSAEVFKKIAPYLTTRSWQFSFYVVGYGLPAGRYRVLEVAIDTAAPEGAMTYLRDITRLGLPFPLRQEMDLFAGKRTARTRSKNEEVRRVQRPHNTAARNSRGSQHG